MTGRRRIARLAVISAFAVLAPASDAGAATDAADRLAAPGAIVAQSGPQRIFEALAALTRRAVLRGRRILTSQEVKTARKIGNKVRKATNYYCGQWADYFRRWPYSARTTAMEIWWWKHSGYTSPAGRAYRYCRSLLYLPIFRYG